MDEYATTCPVCQRSKPQTVQQALPLQPLPVPSRPWEWVTFDLVTGLPASRGFDSVLVIVDRFSKYSHFIACKKTLSADGLARMFLQHVYRLHGLPRTLTTDRDPRVTSAFWQALVGYLRVAHKMTSANRPQADGQSERHIRTLTTMLRCIAQQQGSDWSSDLPVLERAYNSSVNAVTGLTPEEVCTGQKSVLLVDLELPTGQSVPAAEQLAERVHTLHERVQVQLQQAADAAVERHNRHARARSHAVGSFVLVSKECFNLDAEQANKIMPKWYGPYEVLADYSNTCKVRLPAHLRIHPVINKEYLRPWRVSERWRQQTGDDDVPAPLPPVVARPHGVATCYGVNGHGLRQKFLVKLAGEQDVDRRWLFASQLDDSTRQVCIDWLQRRDAAELERRNRLGLRPRR